MTSRDEQPPRRHLHPVEPPYDPEHDGLGRQPHTNHDAERAVLGALLTDPSLASVIETHLDPDDFYRPQHETIWTAIHHVAHTDGIDPDPITVSVHLAKAGELTRIGGGPYLAELMAACPIPGQAEFYAQQVRDAARLRAMQESANRFQQAINTADLTNLDATFDRIYEQLDDAAARLGPRTTSAADTGLVDLSLILSGEAPPNPVPKYTIRDDGNALFYPGKVNGIFGDPEAAKTWLAQTAIVQALNAGETAAMIDVDHNGPDHTAARLLLLGARIDHLADPDRFRYYEPEEADELLAAVADITARHMHVVLIDSLGEVLPMLGVKSVDNDEISTALRRVCQPPANTGSCVITIDHLPKSAEARVTGYAIGGTAKKRVMRGTYIRAEARTQPAPGQVGRITLRIEKDTIGELRKVTPGGYAGTFTLDSTRTAVTTWTVSREDSPVTAQGDFRPTDRMEAVSRFVEQNDQVTFREIKDAVAGKDTTLRTAIQLLVNEGFMTTLPGPKRSTLHHSIAMYREDEDDHS